MSTQLQHTAYSEAEKVDKIINDLMIKYPPDLKVNIPFWLTFNKTIQSTINIINVVVQEQKEGTAVLLNFHKKK